MATISNDSAATPIRPPPDGLNGVTRSKDGTFFEVVNANGYQKLSKEQMANVHKATNGDEDAKALLKKQGITLNDADETQAAQDRAALVSAGGQKFKSDKKSYDSFIAQQDDFGGNHKTFGQKLAKAASAVAFVPVVGGLVSGAVAGIAGSAKGQNSHGVVTVSGKDNKPFQLTRTDGKSPTAKDIANGEKAAKGDAAAQSDALNSGLLVVPAKDDAGKLLDAPMKAGAMGGSTRV